jgi:hypothetical protein
MSFAMAQLGETVEQVDARYGKPAKVVDIARAYQKNGLLISVIIPKGLVEGINFSKIERDKNGDPIPLEENEIKSILDQFSESWNPPKVLDSVTMWQSANGKLQAGYIIGRNLPATHMLCVITSKNNY